MKRLRLALQRARHSIKGRLLLLFVLLALGISVVFLLGMQRLLSNGWQAYARPLVADYVDRLAAEIGSPPSAERARAISQRSFNVRARARLSVSHASACAASP